MHKQSISLPSIAVATFFWIECVTEEMFWAVRNHIICLWCFWCFCFWTVDKQHALCVASRATSWSLSAVRLKLRFWPCGKDAALPVMEVSLLHSSLASHTKSFIARCPSRVAPCLQNLNCLLYRSTYCTGILTFHINISRRLVSRCLSMRVISCHFQSFKCEARPRSLCRAANLHFLHNWKLGCKKPYCAKSSHEDSISQQW